MLSIQPQTAFPAFIVKNGQILVRKLYEYQIIDGSPVAVDLPLPGNEPEYLNDSEYKAWHEQNMKILNNARPK